MLIICGASVRAAAFSAIRAGLDPWCMDLFADTDLKRQCRVTKVEPCDYPLGFKEGMAMAPEGPWLFTGALENHPSLVDEISRSHELRGCPGNVLRSVRAPVTVAALLRSHGFAVPECRLQDSAPDAEKTWLQKPLKSASGYGIQFHDEQSPLPRGCFYQEYIPGRSLSGLFLGLPSGAILLGICEQIIGATWLHAMSFRYAGSIGPVVVPDSTKEILKEMGSVLCREHGLYGLFGIDFVLHNSVPWPVEINPRYTASVEVVERATGTALLLWHGLAFTEPEAVPEICMISNQVVGKAILYAAEDVVFPPEGPWHSSSGNVLTPDFADIPAAGEAIDRGSPILSYFATAADEAACMAQLKGTASSLDNLLHSHR